MTDSTNGAVNESVQPENDKLPTLAFSVTPKLQTILDGFKYVINDNVVGYVDAAGVENQLFMFDGEHNQPVGYSRLLPNDKGVMPLATKYNGTLADSNALKLHLYVEANTADPEAYPNVDFLSDDELSIARLVPSERKAKSETAMLKSALNALSPDVQNKIKGLSIEDLTALLLKAANS